MRFIYLVTYLVWVVLLEPHDDRWRKMLRNDDYRRKAKY